MSVKALLRNARAFEALVRLRAFYSPLFAHIPGDLRNEIISITQEEHDAREHARSNARRHITPGA